MSASNPSPADPAYHAGMRELQDRFDTRRLADRLAEKLCAHALHRRGPRVHREPHRCSSSPRPTPTAGPTARTRAALPGFVRVTATDELAFPELRRQRHVPQPGQHAGQPARSACCSSTSSSRGGCACNGRRAVLDDDPLRRASRARSSSCACARSSIFPNCPRYIHRMQMVETSPYAPAPGHDAAGSRPGSAAAFQDGPAQGRLTGAA